MSKQTMRPSLLMHLPITFALAACAVAPTDPGVLALPGSGKSLEQFNGDDADCRQRAGARAGDGTGGTWLDLQRRYDYAYIQCMYATGHRVPVPGQFTGSPPAGKPPPPPPPPAPRE